jgi:hypothetical protein
MSSLDDGMPDTRRQAEMAVKWGLYNKRRKENGELESESGPGSSLEFTKLTRVYLQDIVERYSIRSIIDVACGDWNWMRHIMPLPGVQSYTGYDINGYACKEMRVLHVSVVKLQNPICIRCA